MSALCAFECAARHGNFTRAAKELDITQPAVSRQIARLERQLTTRLFERSPEGVALTEAGWRFWDAVNGSLGTIRQAASDAADAPTADQVVIACSHDASQHYLLPRYEALQNALGSATRVRFVTYHHHALQLPSYPAADVALAWESSIGAADYVVLHGEVAGPVCAPQFAAKHRDTLARPVSDWGNLPILELANPNSEGASWDDWLRVVGGVERAVPPQRFDSYAFLLHAAVHGHGIAMVRQQYLGNRIETGALVPLAGGFVDFDSRYCGRLSEQGRRKPAARKCLSLLKALA